MSAVVLDVDGTLLDSAGSLSTTNGRAIAEALESGVSVILATGKSPLSVVGLHHKLSLDTPIVCSQGTVICHPSGSIVDTISFTPETALAIVSLAHDLGLAVCAYVNDQLHIDGADSNFHAMNERYNEPSLQRKPALTAVARSGEVNKFLLHRPDGLDQSLRRSLEAEVIGRATVTQAVAEYLEVLPVGTTKADGVARALNILGLGFDDVLAIGDGENDLELLNAASVGVAVANAAHPLLLAADHIVASNDDDGVAEALERFVLVKRESTGHQPRSTTKSLSSS